MSRSCYYSSRAFPSEWIACGWGKQEANPPGPFTFILANGTAGHPERESLDSRCSDPNEVAFSLFSLWLQKYPNLSEQFSNAASTLVYVPLTLI